MARTTSCSKCGVKRSSFPELFYGEDSATRTCRRCHQEYMRGYYRANKATVNARRAVDLQVSLDAARKFIAGCRKTARCRVCGTNKNLCFVRLSSEGTRVREAIDQGRSVKVLAALLREHEILCRLHLPLRRNKA